MEESAQSQTPPPAPAVAAKMPSFGTLYKEAWHLLTFTFWSIIKLVLLTLVAFTAVVVVVFLFMFLGTMLAGMLGDFAGFLIIGALALIVFYLVSLITIIGISQITYIRILTSATKLPIIQTMKASRLLVVPFFTTVFLAQLLILGGLPLLIIPGIVISILFSFVNFVVVVENLKGKAALARSYQLVRPYFWKIILVILAFQIPIFIIGQIYSRNIESYPFIAIIYIPFSILTGLYGQALSVVLYKHAKAITPSDTPVNMKWIKIVAIIGWVVLAALVVFMIYLIAANPGAFYDFFAKPAKS